MRQTAGCVTLWDLDWPEERRIAVDAEQRARLLRQLDQDLAWLERMRVMDYSLLLGVEPPPLATVEPVQQAGRYHFVGHDGQRYHIGLIDMLQHWTGMVYALCTAVTSNVSVSRVLGVWAWLPSTRPSCDWVRLRVVSGSCV